MTCRLNRPDPQDLFDRVKNTFSVNVLGGADVVPESLEHYVVANDAAMMMEFWSIAEQQWKERDPRTACCDNLIKMAERDGVFPRPAGFAEGYVKITGQPKSIWPDRMMIQIGNQTYRVVGSRPARMPDDGQAIVRVKAETPGPDGNNVEATGSIQTIAQGFDQSVEVFGQAFCSGSAPEGCEQFRDRYLNRMQFKPRFDIPFIIETIGEWPCVTRVYERGGECCTDECNDCGCNDCSPNLEFYAVFDGTFLGGAAPQCILNDINDWLNGSIPGRGEGRLEIGQCAKVLPFSPSEVDVVIDGLQCATVSQLSEIEDGIADVFSTLPPSTEVAIRSVELIVAQIVGSSIDFDVMFRPVGEGMDVLECGNLVPDCDVLPILRNVIFADRFVQQEICG